MAEAASTLTALRRRGALAAPSWLALPLAGLGLLAFKSGLWPLVAAGADCFVAGSAVFKGGSVSNPSVYGENIRAIRAAAEAAR